MQFAVLASSGSASDGKFADIDVAAWHWAALIGLILGLLAIDLYLHRGNHEPTTRRALIESGVVDRVRARLLRRRARDVRRQGVRRVHERLRHREVAQRRQRLRLGGHLLDLRDPAPLPAPGAVLGHLRRARAARRCSSSPARRSSSSSGGSCSCSACCSSCRASRSRATATTKARTGTTAQSKLLRRFLPVRNELDGQHFLVRDAGKWVATPLLAALVVVEVTDVCSPSTASPRSSRCRASRSSCSRRTRSRSSGSARMYFLLGGARERFHYLSHALGAILVFVGIKMAVSHWWHMPTAASLAVIVADPRGRDRVQHPQDEADGGRSLGPRDDGAPRSSRQSRSPRSTIWSRKRRSSSRCTIDRSSSSRSPAEVSDTC